jgi:hypothetical protein
MTALHCTGLAAGALIVLIDTAGTADEFHLGMAAAVNAPHTSIYVQS